jgi:hypothetical protein
MGTDGQRPLLITKGNPPAAEAATKVHQLSTWCRRGLPATSSASVVEPIMVKLVHKVMVEPLDTLMVEPLLKGLIQVHLRLYPHASRQSPGVWIDKGSHLMVV